MNARGALGVLVALSASACGVLVGDYGVGTGTTADAGADQHSGSSSGGSTDGGTCVMPSPASCGLAPQCGCGANQACTITDTAGHTQCIEAGQTAIGRACSSFSDCAAGLACTPLGTCQSYCSTAGASCATPGIGTGTGTCFQFTTGSPAINIPNFTTCAIDCTLQDPTACGGIPPSGAAAGCGVLLGTRTDCVAAGTSTTTCGSQNGTNVAPYCAPGYFCSGTGACFQWCPFNVNGICTVAGNTCQHFTNGDITIGGVTYGYCGP